MATKNIAKAFIDGSTASLLDNLYRLCKFHVSIFYINFRLMISDNVCMYVYTLAPSETRTY